jgi:hypothetical protein
MEKLRTRKRLSDYTPVGQELCQGKCDTEAVRTKTGIVVVCNACKRTVIDNRD